MTTYCYKSEFENKEGVFAYTKDGLGSIRELTPINTSSQVPYQRYRYSSYGVTSQMLEGVTQGRKLIENRYAYTGREIEDEVGLYYYRARYYDPELGRFISEDPIGFSSGDVNFYGYVGNSPVNFKDPSGLVCYYSQSSGRMKCKNSSGVEYYNQQGYSGMGLVGRNNSAAESLPNIGPIPQGTYTVGDTYNSDSAGRNTIMLIPDSITSSIISNYGRDPKTFRIHGDNSTNNASEGCVILPANRTKIPKGEIIHVTP